MKNILLVHWESNSFKLIVYQFERRTFYWFIESQTHFGMPKGAKMSLALNKPK